MDDVQHYRYTPDFFVVQKDGDGYFTEVRQDYTQQRSNRLAELDHFHQFFLQEGWFFERYDKRSITRSTLLQTLYTLYICSKIANEQRQMHFYHLRQRVLRVVSKAAYGSVKISRLGKNRVSVSSPRPRPRPRPKWIRLTPRDLSENSASFASPSISGTSSAYRLPTPGESRSLHSAICSGRSHQATKARCRPVSYPLKKWRIGSSTCEPERIQQMALPEGESERPSTIKKGDAPNGPHNA
ncbi:hypothetical protein [Pseudomonas chlororaphis]|uniref:hypothetical protein n=1 Tax=Pseudomonas chlororaphis TaxID=587753 RepID=UPI003B96E41D